MKNVCAIMLSSMLEDEKIGDLFARIYDFRNMEGTSCYCDSEALEQMDSSLGDICKFGLRWIDSGDYHYMSHILARNLNEPFNLLLIDNHPDDKAPEFDGVISCGGWVKDLQDSSKYLQKVISIGPDGLYPSADDIVRLCGNKPIYLSIDKDVLSKEYSRTDWTHGTATIAWLEDVVKALYEHCNVLYTDICGGITPSKGGTPADISLNAALDRRLIELVSTYL